MNNMMVTRVSLLVSQNEMQDSNFNHLQMCKPTESLLAFIEVQ